MKLGILHLILFLIISFDVNAYKIIDQLDRFDLTPFVEIYEGDTVTIVNDRPNFTNSWSKQTTKGLSKGPTAKKSWYKIELLGTKEIEKVLYFNYTLIPELELWIESSQDEFIHLKAGTHNRFEKLNRNISDKGYPFLLSFHQDEKITIYFTTDGKGWPTHTELFLYDVNSFVEKNINESNTIGYLRSIVLTLLTIGLIIGLFTSQKVFIFYTLTFMGGILFAETEIGLFKEFIPVKYASFNYILRHSFNLVYIISLVYFYKYLCAKAEKFDRFLKWYTPLLIVYSVVSINSLCFFDNKIVVYSNFIIIVIISWISFVISTKILFDIRNISTLSKYIFIVQITRLLIIAFFVTLPHLGLVERTSLTDYMYYIFIVYESTVYFYLLMKRSVQVYNDKIDLKRVSLEDKKRYSQAILEGQEKERNRIGRELHDSIGGNLALANKSLENKEIKSLLSSTISSIRNLSHDLIAPNFKKIPFNDVIIDIVSKYNSDQQKIFLQFHEWPTIENIEVKHHCFRIVQELLNNAEKHSKASLIFIQFFGRENNLGEITYEDNGVGFKVDDKVTGVGLRNVKFRANSMDADVYIDSSDKGTFIKINNISIKKVQNSKN